MEAVSPYSAPGAHLESDQKTCESCGASIKRLAEICPACGVRQRRLVSKTALLLITFFFGGLGAHKFYLGKWVQGIFYILFFWTYIPALIALIEFVVYACTSSERLNEKYSAHGSAAVIAIVGVFGGVFVIGILAAIALPAYQDYTVRARVSESILSMTYQKVMVSEYYATNHKLPPTGGEIEPGRGALLHLQSVRVLPGGNIVGTFNADLGMNLTGKSLLFVPRIDGDKLAWECGVEENRMLRYMPASCRHVFGTK